MFLLPDQQLRRADRVMRQRLVPYVHETLSHCQLRAFANEGEPEQSADFLARVKENKVDFLDFMVPGAWGTIWGTTWFEVRGRIDRESVKGRAVELVVDLGWKRHRGPGFQAEGLCYRPDGSVIKAVNPDNCWIPLIDANGVANVELDDAGRFTVYVEAASNPLVEADLPFAPMDLEERADGRPSDYVLTTMDVCAFNQNVFDYLMDLETVTSLMRELKDDDPRYWQLAKALQRSLNTYDERDIAGTLEPAKEKLAGVLSEPAYSSVIHHVAVGHAHIDSAWLWPVRETHRKVARTVSNVLALMDEDSDFTYAMSSAQQYAWLEQEHPDLFARMLQRIKEGRFIPVGGMWVESDNMLPTGESLIRQITFVMRYFREHLGVEPKGLWLPDSFGYCGAWPQIARRAGFEWFLTQKISWNDTTKFPHHSFEWEGIDGSRILTHFPPSDTYGSTVSMQELQYSQRNFLDKDLSRNAILLYGYSDGGGGPTREMVARIRRDHDLAGAPSIDFGTPDELFDRVRHDIVDAAPDETPVFKGELYLELHRATLTSQQEMKRGCRREENLLRTTEYLCAAASVFNPEYRYPREELDGIWKTLLLNQFHDILPGSAIAWVHRQARADYVRDIARLRDIAAEAGASIASARDDADMRSNAAIVPYTAKNGDSWIARTAAVGTQDDDANGTDAVADESTIATTCDDGRIILDNGLLRAIIAPDGTVRSLIDLDNGHELVPDGSGIGHYELLRDEPYEWDAWDIQRDAFLSAEGIDDSHVERVTETKRGGATVHVSSTADGVSIDACITLRPKSKSLEFRTKVDWRASERFLKVDIPMAIQADRAQYECQYGMVERPIQKNTRSDEAKYESCTHRFVRVADAGYAAAVVNASTYGSDVSPIHRNTASGPVRGTMIRLSLLSSPLYPDPNTDKGVHEFAWNVVADASMPAVLDEANRLNAAVLPAVPAFDPLAQLNPVDGVMVLDWVKLADDGSGDLILRVYEAVGGEAHARLAVNAALGKATVRECSIMEDARLDAELPAAFADGDPSVARTAQGAMLSLHPFQLATLRVSCGSDGGNTDGNESGSLR